MSLNDIGLCLLFAIRLRLLGRSNYNHQPTPARLRLSRWLHHRLLWLRLTTKLVLVTVVFNGLYVSNQLFPNLGNHCGYFALHLITRHHTRERFLHFRRRKVERDLIHNVTYPKDLWVQKESRRGRLCGMPVTKGVWVPSLAPKQFEIFNCYDRLTLVSGPRKSSKTIACLHRLVRHAWETPDARVGMFCNVMKNALTGSWDLLYKTIVSEWSDNLEGFEITKSMTAHFATRMPFFRIRNQYGGESEFQLHSLDVEDAIEEKMKGTIFSCIYVSELTNFRTDKIFRFTVPQLRMPHIPFDHHLWISDTNPDEDEGDQFWAYKIWYEERVERDHPRPTFQKQLRLIECKISDNPFLTPEEIEELKALYGRDPDLYAVYIDGKWIQTSSNSMFVGVFSPQRHVIGDPDDEMVPEEDTTMLITGWDPGDRNNSFHVIEKVQRGNTTYFKILDELCITGSDMSLEDYCLMACDMMDEWESKTNKKYKWIHYSDISAVERFRSITGTWDQMVIYRATGGRVMVEGVPKFSGSVRLRVQLIRQLLSEGRLFISHRCHKLIASLRGGLKRGKQQAHYLHDNEHKHPFDSMSYAVLAESSMGLEVGLTPATNGFSSNL